MSKLSLTRFLTNTLRALISISVNVFDSIRGPKFQFGLYICNTYMYVIIVCQREHELTLAQQAQLYGLSSTPELLE